MNNSKGLLFLLQVCKLGWRCGHQVYVTIIAGRETGFNGLLVEDIVVDSDLPQKFGVAFRHLVRTQEFGCCWTKLPWKDASRGGNIPSTVGKSLCSEA